jgi:hypothetical protein
MSAVNIHLPETLHKQVQELAEQEGMTLESFVTLAGIHALAWINARIGRGYIVLSEYLKAVVMRHAPKGDVHVIPVYGHLDVFMGTHAARDVFPTIVNELLLTNIEAYSCFVTFFEIVFLCDSWRKIPTWFLFAVFPLTLFLCDSSR